MKKKLAEKAKKKGFVPFKKKGDKHEENESPEKEAKEEAAAKGKK